MNLGSLLNATKHLPGETPIYVTCLDKDYVILHPWEVESTFIYSEGDGEITFCIDFQTNRTLSLLELKTIMEKEQLSLETQLMVEEEFGDEGVTDILVLEDKIILF